MTKTPNRPWRQVDLTRFIRGARNAGFDVGSVDIGGDGTITLSSTTSRAAADKVNPLDRLLKQ